MSQKLRWKRVGHRTLKFMGPIKMVVRFGSDGKGKLKVLNGDSYDDHLEQLPALVTEAEHEWARYKAMEVLYQKGGKQ